MPSGLHLWILSEAIFISQQKFDEIWKHTTEESLCEMQKHGVMVNEINDKTPFITRANKVIEQFSDRYPVESEELLFDIMNIRNESFDNK
jgi:TRAP-type C4-dicarboxylate transport system substrate-binding protein